MSVGVKPLVGQAAVSLDFISENSRKRKNATIHLIYIKSLTTFLSVSIIFRAKCYNSFIFVQNIL